MKQLALNDNNMKDIAVICDAALKASGMAALNAVNRVAAWIASAKEIEVTPENKSSA